MANSARLLEIKQWVNNKRRNPSAPSAQTDLAIALAYLDELTGGGGDLDGYQIHHPSEIRGESQDEYFGRSNSSRTPRDYQQSSLAQQIDSVENNPDQR